MDELAAVLQDKAAISARFEAAVQQLRTEELAYAQQYGSEALIDSKSSALQQQFQKRMRTLEERIAAVSLTSQQSARVPTSPSHSPAQPQHTPAQLSVRPTLSHSPSASRSPIRSPDVSPPAPTSPLHSSSLDLYASALLLQSRQRSMHDQHDQLRLANKLAQQHKLLAAHSSTQPQPQPQPTHHQTNTHHNIHYQPHIRQLSPDEHKEDAGDDDDTDERLYVVRKEVEVEGRWRREKEQEEREERRRDDEQRQRREKALEERWEERERLVRDEVRQRITQWEDEARRKEEKEAEKRERLREGWRREKDSREKERRQWEAERRDMQRLYELQVKKLSRRLEEEREELTRDKKQDKERQEEDRRKQNKQLEEEVARRQQQLDRTQSQLHTATAELQTANERIIKLEADRERRSDEHNKLDAVVRGLEQQLSSSEAALSSAKRDVSESKAEVDRLQAQLQRMTSLRAADLHLFHSQLKALQEMKAAAAAQQQQQRQSPVRSISASPSFASALSSPVVPSFTATTPRRSDNTVHSSARQSFSLSELAAGARV